MDVLFNVIIELPQGPVTDHAVLIDNGTIIDIVTDTKLPAGKRHDLGGARLAAGLIDLQVNGGGGVLFNDHPTPQGLAQIATAHHRCGTTALLATLITDHWTVTQQAREAIARAKPPGVLGLHLEGPFLAAEKSGVHDPARLCRPNAELLAQICADPNIRMITLAPESVSDADIRQLTKAGIRVCLGHSNADFDQAQAAFQAGASGATHLFNAMSGWTGRAPGLVGAALYNPDVWCGIIADGHHVHPASIALAWRLKQHRLILVSDAMPPAGSQDSDFVLYGHPVTVSDGRCVDQAGRLAGSAIDLLTAVRYCVRQVGIPISQALALASASPADFLGIADQRGRIAPGLAADLIVLDDDLALRQVWMAGRPL